MRLLPTAALLLGLLVAPAASAKTVTFRPTGAEQTFTVPPGVMSLEVALLGGNGGADFAGDSTGGGAEGVKAELPVVPGQVLYVDVGSDGTQPALGGSGVGGFNGGADGAAGAGGGGGASDVRTSPADTPGSPGSRILVAGGGGGGGSVGLIEVDRALVGGAGGAAGAAGQAGASFLSLLLGGGGGGAGTATAGGTGGTGGTGITAAGQDGADGGLAGGGVGGASDGASLGPSGGGGGGGGGLFGGAGGGAGGCCEAGGGGGGGGSSFAIPGAAASFGTDPDGPLVSISYDQPIMAVGASLDFPGTQTEGTTSAPRTLTISNHGPVPLVISGLTFLGAHPDDFFVGASTCDAPVAPGGTCALSVRFVPQATGPRSAVLEIAGNAVTGTAQVSLSGTGGAAAAGAPGTAGPAGHTGAAGPAGPRGVQGPPGGVELVTCRTRHKRTTCRGRLVSGPVTFRFGAADTVARATLARGRTVYARGTAVRRGARIRLLLAPVRRITPGRYTLKVGKRRRSVVLRP